MAAYNEDILINVKLQLMKDKLLSLENIYDEMFLTCCFVISVGSYRYADSRSWVVSLTSCFIEIESLHLD